MAEPGRGASCRWWGAINWAAGLPTRKTWREGALTIVAPSGVVMEQSKALAAGYEMERNALVTAPDFGCVQVEITRRGRTCEHDVS